ncbi:acetyl/propionyl/methylcrotonyl-CoA carboxylase subunit alpha [Nocardioides sp.]|uniref:acetyl/propionyl/methylcrotonyl-CoA carboxylase subunit alpha n=1 Tax=Nocardioides sp. TaxID=35761 RepID=UPI002B265AF3|nr:biotin carboxylase N-terminal domain-containing protein [Nocardioides sp.]
MHTLLIANRGEIAVRVMRTAEAMGIHSVAIFTDLDADAPHVHAADDAVRVESYLDVEAVVAAAQSVGADAVHPGYGFLSERSAFAAALEAAGITLVGPTAEVMEQMGRKDAAREIALAAGVPVVPTGDDAPYPVLVKAAAGGGGKGMRIVRSEAEMGEALAAAKRESLAAFGDDTMLVEKYVESGRHIEVQVVGDTHGTVLHFFERDCSTQRRHQKVLEEAPAPTLDEATRQRVRQAAVDLAAHVGYTGAGTVEFLLDNATGEFYFLEMNTRLQVEHPVTEAITGVDLVELQLRVAAGEPIGFTQDDVRLTGHAIEARIYAEDAFGGFLPQAGTATIVRWPEETVGDTTVRVDHALESGQVVSTSFDPMLGKVIAHGPDRESARQALVEALDGTAIFGLTTNTGYLRTLVAGDDFRAAAIDTAWLDHHEVERPADDAARAAAGEVLHRELDAAPRHPWQGDGFRMSGPRGRLVQNGRVLEASGWFDRMPADADGIVPVALYDRGRAFVRRTRVGCEVVHAGQWYDFTGPATLGRSTAAGDGTITSPMPGTLLDVRVAAGDAVSAGDVLGVMEAMKMEHALKAPFDGTVTEVGSAAGATVALGATLFVVAAADA